MLPSLPESPMFRSRRGFTLLELVIVTAVILILSGLGVVMAREMIPSWRTKAAAQKFEQDLHEARALAILHDRETMVEVTDYDASPYGDNVNYGAWQVSVGNLANNATFFDVLPFEDSTGVDSYQGEGRTDLQKGGNDHHKGASLLEPDAPKIVFDPRGWVANDVTDFTHSEGGALEFTFVNTTADDQDDGWKVLVFRGGMVRLVPTRADVFENLGGGTAEQSGY